MSFYDMKRKCAKCKQHKKLGGGHQRLIPGRGMYFVCAECKLEDEKDERADESTGA